MHITNNFPIFHKKSPFIRLAFVRCLLIVINRVQKFQILLDILMENNTFSAENPNPKRNETQNG
jgi:hypothetical protein